MSDSVQHDKKRKAETHRTYLKAMGIDVCLLKSNLKAIPDKIERVRNQQDASLSDEEKIQSLSQVVSICKKCKLHETRTQTVFGVGSIDATCFFIGEGPGQEEDRKGEPFVGRAGQLLDNMLLAIKLKRENVYIANIVKCRPPENRNPEKNEIESCLVYLEEQISITTPKLLVALGKVAAQALLDTESPISKLRGTLHASRFNVPVFVTYHPAYLLRRPSEKVKSWDDFTFINEFLQQK